MGSLASFYCVLLLKKCCLQILELPFVQIPGKIRQILAEDKWNVIYLLECCESKFP